MTNSDPKASGHNIGEYSVGELSLAIKRTLEGGFERVRVRGEISGFKRATSGHLYMALKDADAAIKAVCWKGQAMRLGLDPADGMEVVATGRITTYGERSEYQLVLERLELAGIGALLKTIEDRRRRLAAEGLFDAARKRPLPVLPEIIGIVTSPTGAVIRDILHRLADRFPRRVLLWPVAVQGAGAAQQIAEAIAGFNALDSTGAIPRPDLLIVARGGGSIEDLMAFNEEIVVRAAAASRIPLIAAIGHETDTTLIDHAADHRAPTPTAAAEIAVPRRADLLAEMAKLGHRLIQAMGHGQDRRRSALDHAAEALPHPRRRIEEKTQSLDFWHERWQQAQRHVFGRRHEALLRLAAELKTPRQRLAEARHALNEGWTRLRHGFDIALERRGNRLAKLGGELDPRRLADHLDHKAGELAGLGRLLESYSYSDILRRGFVLVRDGEGAPLARAAAIRADQRLRLQFHDGEIAARSLDGAAGEAAPRPPRNKPRDSGDQGSLL